MEGAVGQAVPLRGKALLSDPALPRGTWRPRQTEQAISVQSSKKGASGAPACPLSRQLGPGACGPTSSARQPGWGSQGSGGGRSGGDLSDKASLALRQPCVCAHSEASSGQGPAGL